MAYDSSSPGFLGVQFSIDGMACQNLSIVDGCKQFDCCNIPNGELWTCAEAAEIAANCSHPLWAWYSTDDTICPSDNVYYYNYTTDDGYATDNGTIMTNDTSITDDMFPTNDNDTLIRNDNSAPDGCLSLLNQLIFPLLSTPNSDGKTPNGAVPLLQQLPLLNKVQIP